MKKAVNKKSYNPFKMWGSWVGLFIGILMKFSVYLILTPFYYLSFINYLNPLDLFLLNNCNTNCYGILVFSDPIVFFLYGWAIHSLVRRYRK